MNTCVFNFTNMYKIIYSYIQILYLPQKFDIDTNYDVGKCISFQIRLCLRIYVKFRELYMFVSVLSALNIPPPKRKFYGFLSANVRTLSVSLFVLA